MRASARTVGWVLRPGEFYQKSYPAVAAGSTPKSNGGGLLWESAWATAAVQFGLRVRPGEREIPLSA